MAHEATLAQLLKYCALKDSKPKSTNKEMWYANQKYLADALMAYLKRYRMENISCGVVYTVASALIIFCL
jgi:hypothetical protein